VLLNPNRSNWASANIGGNGYNVFGGWSQGVWLNGGQGLIIKNNP
jgi:hypothetical protein